MPDELNPFTYLKEMGGVFKFGSGVLGKSSIAVGIFMLCGAIALWRLKSDWLILCVIGILAIILLIWLFSVMRFAHKHPEAALLEGAEWTGWQKFQAAAKGYLPSSKETEPSPAPGTSDPIILDKSAIAEGQDK
jgi:hypothetical protein